jgi:hypothetical protein
MFEFNLERPLRYILDGHETKPSTLTESDPGFFSGICDVIAVNLFGHEAIGEIQVSTIFLGFDHARQEGPPILFETMIFGGGDLDGYQTRCSTWDEAMQMHANAVEHVKNAFQELAKASGA